VDKESRVFRADIGDTSSENSEMAIRSVCRKVDVTGVEVVDIKRISEGGRFRSYVLVALPMGDANILRKGKVDEEIRKGSSKRADEMFNKMDKQNEVNSPVN
jgi:aspartate 1-decarboxylase